MLSPCWLTPKGATCLGWQIVGWTLLGLGEDACTRCMEVRPHHVVALHVQQQGRDHGHRLLARDAAPRILPLDELMDGLLTVKELRSA